MIATTGDFPPTCSSAITPDGNTRKRPMSQMTSTAGLGSPMDQLTATTLGSVVVENEVDDDNTRFGRNVADFLTGLPRQQQRPARIRLEELMQEIEFGQQASEHAV